jgi:hypothetical protein
MTRRSETAAAGLPPRTAPGGPWVRSRRGGADTTTVTAVWELPPRPPVRRKRVVVVLACVLVGVAAVAVVVIQLVHIALEPWHALTAASKRSEQQLPTIQALPEATLLVPGSQVFLRHAAPATILGGGASILTWPASTTPRQRSSPTSINNWCNAAGSCRVLST